MKGQMIGKDTSIPLENRADKLSLFDKTEKGGVTVQTNIPDEFGVLSKSVDKKGRVRFACSKQR